MTTVYFGNVTSLYDHAAMQGVNTGALVERVGLSVLSHSMHSYLSSGVALRLPRSTIATWSFIDEIWLFICGKMLFSLVFAVASSLPVVVQPNQFLGWLSSAKKLAIFIAMSKAPWFQGRANN